MALPVVTTDDYNGYYKLALNEFKTEDLQLYITTFTEQYVRQIIGDAAYSDMSVQDFQKWLDLSNGIDFVDINGDRKHLIGLREPLIGFIYFEYVRDNFTSTAAGKVKGKSENSERATDIEVAGIARSRYNRLICDLNESTKAFLEANETLESLINASYDLGDDRYVLVFADPKYLNTGTEISLDDNTYEVTEIVSFGFDAGATGLDFTGQTATWNFSEVVISSNNTSGTLYQIAVASTEGLVVGNTVNIGGTDYTVLEVIEGVCFTIDGGAGGLDFTGQTAAWAFSSTVTVSIDLNDNTYLVTVEDSRYVAVGADVDINATTYTISSVTNNFLINAGGTGFDFTNDTASWEPYESVEFQEQEIVGI